MTNVYQRLGVPHDHQRQGAVDPAVRRHHARARWPRRWSRPRSTASTWRRCRRARRELIAEATGAEAGLVTAGAAAGLLLGTAACVTGLDPGRMNRLPDTRGMRERGRDGAQPAQLLRPRRARGRRAAGRGRPARPLRRRRRARRRGLGDRGCDRRAHRGGALGRRARTPGRALEEVVEVAHAAGVPVLVDAAAQLPPADNLRRFIAAGADLVAFSGGKAIGGPQASGILCGRRDLIMAAALQNLDLDVFYEQWAPPAALHRQGAAQGPAAARHRPRLQGRQGGDRRAS